MPGTSGARRLHVGPVRSALTKAATGDPRTERSIVTGELADTGEHGAASSPPEGHKTPDDAGDAGVVMAPAMAGLGIG